jgi:hypothetical protein
VLLLPFNSSLGSAAEQAKDRGFGGRTNRHAAGAKLFASCFLAGYPSRDGRITTQRSSIGRPIVEGETLEGFKSGAWFPPQVVKLATTEIAPYPPARKTHCGSAGYPFAALAARFS